MTLLGPIVICVGSLVLYKFARMILTGRRLNARTYMLCSDETIWRVLVPSWLDIPGVVHGNLRPLRVKHTEFDQAGMEAYVQVSLEKPNCPVTFIADIEAIKEITRPKAPFLKDVKATKSLVGMYGPNLATVEGDDWRRHRRIIQKSFSEENNKLVWSESISATQRLFDRWDAQEGPEVHLFNVNVVAEALALMVISAAALGQRMSWEENPDRTLPHGYTMPFQQAITTVTKKILTRAVTPRWAEGWSESTRTMAAGYKEFGRYLRDLVDNYRCGGKLDQDLTGTETLALAPTENLFKIIMTASEEEPTTQGKVLANEEATGNAFLFLMAGHETTAHAISFSLGFLAAYPEIQQEIYAQIKTVLGSRERLEYNDMGDLKLVTGCLYEALRMYPLAPRNARIVAEDTVISVARNGKGANENERESLFVPAGSRVVIAITAVHYNPQYWPEPEEFRPSRFAGEYNKDAFLAFGTGRRACIGRRFAETEGTAVLAAILSQYEVSIDESKFSDIPGETHLARRERLLQPKYHMTLAPEHMPLVFKRRSKV